MKTKHYNIPIFIPELACPFQCIYCNQKKITGQLKVLSPDEVKQIIDEVLDLLKKYNVSTIELGA